MPERFPAAGSWHEAPQAAQVVSPFDGSPIGEHFVPTPRHVELALAGARATFERTARLSSGERGRLLSAVSQRVAERAATFADLICAEAGKPIRQARAEVARAVETFRLGALEAERLEGRVLPLDSLPANAGRLALTAWFPLGPLLAITPFNFPLNLVAHKLAPAFGAGDSAVLKPASATPLTALALARAIEETGLLPPGGALSVLPLPGRAAASLTGSPVFRALSFTGSPAVGWGLRAQVAPGTRVLLELGGNAAAIVCADADLPTAAAACASAAFAYAGQICISLQRLLVEAAAYDEFMQHFLARVASLRTGDPRREDTDLGPLISRGEAERVGAWIDEARQRGARVLAGGERSATLIAPTVLTDVPRECRVWSQEAFGPLVVVERFARFEQALALANDSAYGLQAALFTRDHERVLGAFRRLDVGQVIHDAGPTFRADGMPYGGVKQSGLGREGLGWAMRELSVERALVTTMPRAGDDRVGSDT